MSTVFWENYTKLCKQAGQTPTGVARAVGISSGNASAWRNGRIPSMQIVYKLAEYFDVPPNKLIFPEHFSDEETEKAPAEPAGVTDDQLQFALFGDAPITDEDFEDVRRFASIIADRARRRQKNNE